MRAFSLRSYDPIFGSCDLDLDPMTFIYELDPNPLKMYRQAKNELSPSRLSTVIVSETDIYREMPPETRPRCFAGGSNSAVTLT